MCRASEDQSLFRRRPSLEFTTKLLRCASEFLGCTSEVLTLMASEEVLLFANTDHMQITCPVTWTSRAIVIGDLGTTRPHRVLLYYLSPRGCISLEKDICALSIKGESVIVFHYTSKHTLLYEQIERIIHSVLFLVFFQYNQYKSYCVSIYLQFVILFIDFID